jgi:hypothetical protein
LLTRMTGNSLHMQWPLTSQLHGSVCLSKSVSQTQSCFKSTCVVIGDLLIKISMPRSYMTFLICPILLMLQYIIIFYICC